MVATTLNNLVLKTASVGNVKLPAPADRIGSGFAADIDHPPTTILSLGQFPLPRLPEPLTRSRQVVFDVMPMSMPLAAVPAGSAGSSSGVSAATPTGRTVTATTVTTFLPTGRASRASYPWSSSRWCRVGGDCQSPDRHDGNQDRNAKPETGWRRMAAPAAAAAK